MKKLICLILGHKLKSFWQKWEQMTFMGKFYGKSGTEIIYCERCSLFKSSVTGKFISI